MDESDGGDRALGVSHVEQSIYQDVRHLVLDWIGLQYLQGDRDCGGKVPQNPLSPTSSSVNSNERLLLRICSNMGLQSNRDLERQNLIPYIAGNNLDSAICRILFDSPCDIDPLEPHLDIRGKGGLILLTSIDNLEPAKYLLLMIKESTSWIVDQLSQG